MRKRDMIVSTLLTILLIYVICNMAAINSFLAFSMDKTTDAGHSEVIVPNGWNATSELNISGAKSNLSVYNGYLIWDVFEDWPEEHITNISQSKCASMEKGSYVILNTSNCTYSGEDISKQYFYNPTRDSDTQWDCIGINYVFTQDDTNYAVQVHYLTKTDYSNKTVLRDIDAMMEDFRVSIHDKNYDGFFSLLNHGYEFLNNTFNKK